MPTSDTCGILPPPPAGIDSLSVSVIIPAYNEAAHLARTLAAVAAQQQLAGVPLEVILVNHSSTDDTATIAADHGATVVTQAAGGTISAVRNTGVRASRHTILAFLDADCAPDTGWLAAALAQFKRAEVVACGGYPEVPEGQQTTWVQDDWATLCRHNPTRPQPVEWLPSANLLVRRSAFFSAGGFDESLMTCEDADLGFRLAPLGLLMQDPACKVTHYREPTSLWALFQKERWHARDNWSGAARHGWVPSELPSLLLPPLFALGAVATLLTLLLALVWPPFSPGLWWLAGPGLMLLPPLLYTAKALPHVHRAADALRYLTIYGVYFAARGLASVQALLRWRPARPAATGEPWL